MYVITKEFDFAASHQLDGLPDGHKCSRLHGHSYRVVVELSSLHLDEVGFIVDYGDLAPLKEYIDTKLDHRHLNEVVPVVNPTAENLARYLYDWCKVNKPEWPVTKVGVSEGPRTWAWYE